MVSACLARKTSRPRLRRGARPEAYCLYVEDELCSSDAARQGLGRHGADGCEKCGLEVKAIEAVQPIHKARLLSSMKLLDIPLGLIINFNELRLTDGISRWILPGANSA